MLELYCAGCQKDQVYRLDDRKGKGSLWVEDQEMFRQFSSQRAGAEIMACENGGYIFLLTGFQWLPGSDFSPCRRPLLKALMDLSPGKLGKLYFSKQKTSVAVITLSDKGADGLRLDESGPEIIRILEEQLDVGLAVSLLIPDDWQLLKALLADLAYNQKYNLICTTGGTGIGPRDITPQVTEALLDVKLPGFCQAMMSASLKETPNGMLSRAQAGLAGPSLVLNLPGSPKAVRCNLSAVLPALKHALAKASGDNTDCGGK